ncbi:hypothetical protein V1512DRAFT_262825 [Lipomyces arxii]|uniref:uncharacterized protein n=1 Tax=Lipomyces arxii TaxID=56418 RepID=UPI0034D0186C
MVGDQLGLNMQSSPPAHLAALSVGVHSIPIPATTPNSQHLTEQSCKWNFTGVDEELVYTDHELLWYQSGVLRRKFGFPEDTITHALFTYFENPSPQNLDEFASSTATDGARRKSGKGYGQLKNESSRRLDLDLKRAIVICLKESMHIFFLSGARYVVNIPFTVSKVFATDRGLIIEMFAETETDPTMKFLHTPNESISANPTISRFFSLSDPMNDLGLVSKSPSGTNDSNFAPTETLIYVSNKTPGGHSPTLLAIFDSATTMVHTYQFRYKNTDSFALNRRRTMSRRRSSMLQSMTEDSVSGISMSGLDIQRTPVPRTDISLTLDRMGSSGMDAPDLMGSLTGVAGSSGALSWLYDSETLQREIELSHIESFACDASEQLCYMIHDTDRKRQALIIACKRKKCVTTLVFSIEGGHLRFEDSTSIPCQDAVPMSGKNGDSLRHPFILLLLDDNSLRLYDPFLKIYSPSLPLTGTVVGLVHAVENRVSLRHIDGTLLRIELIQTPSSAFVQMCMRVVNSMIDPVQQVVLFFYFSTAMYRLRSSDLSVGEWDAFVVALLASWFVDTKENAEFEAQDINGLSQTLSESADEEIDCCVDGSQSWLELLNKIDTGPQPWPFKKHKNLALSLLKDLKSSNYDHYNLTRSRAAIVAALHLLAEELKLDIAASKSKQQLGMLLGQLVRWLGWSAEWRLIYTSWNIVYDDVSRTASTEPITNPPNIFSILYDALSTSLKPQMMTLNELQRQCRPANDLFVKRQSSTVLLKTEFIVEIFTVLVEATPETVYREVVEKLLLFPVSKDVNQSRGRALMNEIERYPESIVIVFKEAIAWCQDHTPTEWGADALELIGRRDLMRLAELGTSTSAVQISRHTITREKPRDMQQIIQSAVFDSESLGPWDGESEVDRANVSRLIFRADRRLQEVQKILQTTRMQSGKFEYSQLSSSFNEADMHTAQQEMARMIGTRTLAVPVGRGAFLYSARIPLLTEKFPIPKMNFNVVMKPSMATITLDKHIMNEENISWGLFHNGVASGLSVSKEAKEISGSWIVFNKPQELSAQHAGFLLGLGLNGHLTDLAEWHIYNYLRPKNTLTSVGLLLGISASYLGTMNAKMTKVLSVHVVALLPAGSADLNIASQMQTAGLMGVGLLYYDTNHRRMSEILISEIDKYNASGIASSVQSRAGINAQSSSFVAAAYDGSKTDGREADGVEALRDEGYLLAAGFALGLVNIGSGSNAAILDDLHIMERLLAIGTGSSKSSVVGSGATTGPTARKHHLLDKSAAGCVVALLLIYLKTEDSGVANKIDVPETEMLFEYVRPDLLLLRTLASRLIMWSTIGSTREWIAQSVRDFLRPRVDLQDIIFLDSDDLPLLNIVCGLCFAIGIRYAGTADSSARMTLIYYLDQFVRLCSLPSGTHDQRMTKATARRCQNVLALSSAIVMAGTGDLDVLRRLRRLHGTIESTVPYGSHLASHLALGLLFAGGGEYSLDTFSSPNVVPCESRSGQLPELSNQGTKNPVRDPGLLGVAGLVIALYPQFPNDVLDNQVHLQAFRHFWTFACQRRCLIVRDIETMRPVSMPVRIDSRAEDGSVKSEAAMAPCLLPPLTSLLNVRTVSLNHWPVVLDLQTNDVHMRALNKSLTLYTEDRRSGHQRRTSDGFVPFDLVLRGLGPPGNSAGGLDGSREGSRNQLTTAMANSSTTMQKLLQVGLQNEMDRAEKAMIVPSDVFGRRPQIQSTSADIAGTLARFIECPRSADDLWNVQLAVNGLPRWAVSEGINDKSMNGEASGHGRPLVFVPQDTIERLKIGIWRMRQVVETTPGQEQSNTF